MADYYPLLSRALDSMPDRSSALRKAVYDRARGALIGQLRSLEPPLSEADIALESNALEHAIGRLEADHGGDPLPANDPPPLPPPVFTPPPPPAPPERTALPEAAAPSAPGPSGPVLSGPALSAPLKRIAPALPPAPPLDLRSSMADARGDEDFIFEPAPPAEVVPVVQIQARKARTPETIADKRTEREPEIASLGSASAAPDYGTPFLPDAPPAANADASAYQSADPSALPSDAASGRQRPRIDVVAPRSGRSRLLRNIFVGSVLVVVIGLIAVAAFLLRDKPNEFQPTTAENQDTPAPGADSKYGDRVGGDGSAAPGMAERPGQSSGTPAKPPTQPDVAVAQRAVLYEENTAGGNAAPTAVQGHAVWRLEAVNGEQGQPLETAVRANVEFPEAGLTLLMTLRRNLDTTLPASHTVELAFTNTSSAGAKRSIQDVGLLSGKDEESARGSPVSGLPVRVRENLFLIGLSSLRNDIDRNTDMLQHKNWFDLAVKFASGQRGIITFEKGNSGNQVMQSAFDEWRR